MNLPNASQAFIPKNKLINYILSETHPIGKFKAKIFRKLGFNEENADLLETALKKIAQSQEIKDVTQFEYGIKYIIDGEILAPIGKLFKVRTIWIVEIRQIKPRFITVYPV